MRFESKAHMAQELLSGKRFRNKAGTIIHYNENKSYSPFRIGEDSMSSTWDTYIKDIWEEVKPRHVHQDLIDSYEKGQAWQYLEPHMAGLWQDSKSCNTWIEPCWNERNEYRLHPYNDLIQAFNNGAKIQYNYNGKWADTTNPNWCVYLQHRIKPTTKTIYEWMYKSMLDNKWEVESLIMDEKEAKKYFCKQEYKKTGRSWEVEV